VSRGTGKEVLHPRRNSWYGL